MRYSVLAIVLLLTACTDSTGTTEPPGTSPPTSTTTTTATHPLAHYAEFYEIDHVLVLGRVTSGRGGEIIVERARQVLATQFPELTMELHVPDERMKRVGQSVAAASLPEIDKESV
jgi:hypothetical protein